MSTKTAPQSVAWRLAPVILLVGALVLAACYTSPGKLVVDANGEILGVVNMARALVQGRSFWGDQLSQAQIALAWEQDEPNRMDRIERELAPALRDTERFLESVYREHPELRPSSAARKAASLREQASRIEAEEFDEMLEQQRQARMAGLRGLIPLREERAR